MKSTDVMCPVCGAINRGLILDETDGWMECRCCGSVARPLADGLADVKNCRWQVIRPLPHGKRTG